MFVSRVLIGKTTVGNGAMKTRPVGFDSTTDGKHIFVTYHDAQAFAEYLITYKQILTNISYHFFEHILEHILQCNKNDEKYST